MKNDRFRLAVHIKPGASQNQIVNYDNGILRVRIAAPPVGGKANAKLIEFMSEILDTAKSNITIEKGFTGKDKILTITGVSEEQLSERLIIFCKL